MKKLLCLAIIAVLLLGLCACGQTPEEIAPYSYVLKLYHNHVDIRYGYSYPQYYAFYDIDGNGTKELLVGAKTNEDYGVGIYELYTIQDGKAVEQDIFVWDAVSPAPQVFQNGAIKVIDLENTMIYYHRFEAGGLKQKLRLYDNSLTYEADLRCGVPENVIGSPYYFYDTSNPDEPAKRTPITKEEFEQMQKDMIGNGQVVDIAWTPLADYEGGPWWLFW